MSLDDVPVLIPATDEEPVPCGIDAAWTCETPTAVVDPPAIADGPVQVGPLWTADTSGVAVVGLPATGVAPESPTACQWALMLALVAIAVFCLARATKLPRQS